MSYTLSITVDREFATITDATAAIGALPAGVTHVSIYKNDIATPLAESPAPVPLSTPVADDTTTVAPASEPNAPEPAPVTPEVKALREQATALVARVRNGDKSRLPRLRELAESAGAVNGITSIPADNLAQFIAAINKEFPQ